MLQNLRQSRVTRVSSARLVAERTQLQRTLRRSTVASTPNLAKHYRFFQAEEARRRGANSATNASRGTGQGVRSSGGAGAAAGGAGGSGGGRPPPGGYVKPLDLNPTEKISRNKKQFKKFLEQVKLNGITEPIKFVRHNGQKYVVDGHHRLKAAKVLGIKSVPVEEVELPYKSYHSASDLLNYFGP